MNSDERRRIDKLDKKIAILKKDIEYIKNSLSNHLSRHQTALENLQRDVNWLKEKAWMAIGGLSILTSIVMIVALLISLGIV